MQFVIVFSVCLFLCVFAYLEIGILQPDWLVLSNGSLTAFGYVFQCCIKDTSENSVISTRTGIDCYGLF